jgi:hypothetical protein
VEVCRDRWLGDERNLCRRESFLARRGGVYGRVGCVEKEILKRRRRSVEELLAVGRSKETRGREVRYFKGKVDWGRRPSVGRRDDC